jgi:hypothetical protein
VITNNSSILKHLFPRVRLKLAISTLLINEPCLVVRYSGPLGCGYQIASFVSHIFPHWSSFVADDMEAPRSMAVLTRVKGILPSRWMRKLYPCYSRNCMPRPRFAAADNELQRRFQLRAVESHDATVIRVTPGLCDLTCSSSFTNYVGMLFSWKLFIRNHEECKRR